MDILKSVGADDWRLWCCDWWLVAGDSSESVGVEDGRRGYVDGFEEVN